MRKRFVVASFVLGLVLALAGLPRTAPRSPEGPQVVRERTVTLRHDAALEEVMAEFDTTMPDDRFVSVEGLATFPAGAGSESWGRVEISRDPSGSLGRATRDHPPGTTYSLVVRFYDAQQGATATFVPPSVTKPQ